MNELDYQQPITSDLSEGPTGIVIAGAGARGAYEAGVLSVLLPVLETQGRHPWLFVGTSAGAINAVLFASWAHRPAEEAAELALARWRAAGRAQVFNPILPSMMSVTARYAAQLAGFRVRLTHLLDTAPQRQTLDRWLNWPILHANLEKTFPSTSVAVVTTACADGSTQVFVEGSALTSMPPRDDDRAIDYVKTTLNPQHVMASAAIPLAFPPVRIEQDNQLSRWHVDGGVRMNAPLKPAVALGARQLIVIATHPLTAASPNASRSHEHAPDLYASAASLLHGALTDRMAEDVRTLGKINALLKRSAPENIRPGMRAYRPIPYLFAGPTTRDALGQLAEEVYRSKYRGPRAWRYELDFPLLSRLIGGNEETHGELLSYLFFDPDFIDAAIEMGRRDAQALLQQKADGLPWQWTA